MVAFGPFISAFIRGINYFPRSCCWPPIDNIQLGKIGHKITISRPSHALVYFSTAFVRLSIPDAQPLTITSFYSATAPGLKKLVSTDFSPRIFGISYFKYSRAKPRLFVHHDCNEHFSRDTSSNQQGHLSLGRKKAAQWTSKYRDL
jgi:hypothetical protein